MLRTKITIAITAFLQIGLVAVNTYLIAQKAYIAVFLVAVSIGVLWATNIKKVAFGTWVDIAVYALASGLGAVTGLFIADKLLIYFQ